MPSLATLLIGLGLSTAIAGAAYARRSLAPSGVAGAVLVGTAIFAFGGWAWWALLIAFFVLSSALSHFRADAKREVARDFDKGGRRDLGQTLANGGVGTALAVAAGLLDAPVLLAAFVGAMATVNADTWATELGVLSRRPPRLITTWQVVRPGTSGGVSAFGTAATLAGGLLIGLLAAGFLAVDAAGGGGTLADLGVPAARALPVLIAAGALGGLVGSLGDSLLGATVQVIFYSERRGKETEKRVDPDGTPNRTLRGWRWMNNDAVNGISSGIGAAAAAGVWLLLH